MRYRHGCGLVLAATLLLGAGCDEAPGKSTKHLERRGDAPLVVYVDAPGEQEVEFVDEVEPNDEPGQATALTVGQGGRGALDGEKDRDLYKVEVARDMHLRAQVAGIEGVDLVLELLDAQGKVLATSDRGPQLVLEGLPNIHVTAGSYFLAVSEFVKPRPKKKTRRKKKGAEEPEEQGRQGLSPVYQLVVTALTSPLPPRTEIEPNDNRELATELLLGDEVQGFMGWAHDQDVWKLSIEGFASHYGLNIELSGAPGVTLELAIANERGEPVLTRHGDKGGNLSVENLVVVADDAGDPEEPTDPAAASEEPGQRVAAGFYYATISAKRSNPADPYRLRMHTRLIEPDEEIEPNDQPGQAVVLDVSGGGAEVSRRGYLSPDDVDHYAIEPTAEPYVLSATCAPLSDIDVSLEVKVDGKTLALSDEYKQSGKETLAEMRIQAGQRVSIAVKGQGVLGHEARYQLGISTFVPASRGLEPAGSEGLLDEYGSE